MARATPSKTRGLDKSKTPALQAATPDIIPGVFSEIDWLYMLEEDSKDEFIATIVDEIVDYSLEAIYKNHIQSQILPFIINKAKDAIEEIVECYFLARDDGECNLTTDLGWLEDEEPDPAETDCWAQGSMPKNFIAAISKTLSEIPEAQEEIFSEISVLHIKEESLALPELPDTVSETEEPPATIIDFNESQEVLEKESLPKTSTVITSNQIKKGKFTKRAKFIADSKGYKSIDFDDDDVEETPTQASSQKEQNPCSSYMKSMAVRVSGNKDVIYDERGNVVAVPKLDPDKLPTHKVSVKYTVVDSAKEMISLKTETKSRQVSFQSKDWSPSVMNIVTSKMPNQSRLSNVRVPLEKSFPAAVRKTKIAPELALDDDFGRCYSMFGEMEIAQGITVKEHGQVKKGRGLFYGKLHILDDVHNGMKPVSLRMTNPSLTVADLLDRHSPILRHLGESPPLPPIGKQAKEVT